MVRTRGRLLLGLALLLTAAACSEGPKLSIQHQETGLNSAFRYSGMAYPEYIDHMKRVILQTRRDLTPERQDTIVAWNSPFIFQPDPARCPAVNGKAAQGILLIHGLTDSPFHLWDLGRHFQQRCFLVYGLLLPGHGTVPGDLLEVTYEEWIKAANYGIAALRPQVQRLYVGGFSTGGALAVHAALAGQPVDGLVLFAPALGLHSSLVALAGTVDSLSGSKSGRWVDVAQDQDPAKYESFPLNAASQIFKLTREVSRMRAVSTVAVPMFVVQSADDMTVDPQTTLDFFRTQTHPGSRMLMYSRAAADWGDPRIQNVPSAFPAEHVINFAHLSLTNAPENVHYGRAGDYRNCLHYLKEPQAWAVCKRDPVPLGEINEDVLAAGVMRRLTYNPDFPHMLRELDAFLDRLK